MQTENRTYFVDCYKANVPTFIDFLSQFDRLFLYENRLSVIGALRYSEMRADIVRENETVFQSLSTREYHRVIVISEEEDFSVDSIKCNWIRIFHSTLETLEDILKFKGVIFLKGHRYYKLENLVC
jgi:UDP-N-acetylmuramyl pentapeptide synthase